MNKKIRENGFQDKTESYSEMISYCMVKEGDKYPQCEPEKGCNGLAVIYDSKVVCLDLFGTEEVYTHYFPKLRDSAFRMDRTGKDIFPVEINEAYYKVLDTLDNYETAKKHPETGYSGAGSFSVVEGSDLVGFSLNIEGQLVHNVLFSK